MENQTDRVKANLGRFQQHEQCTCFDCGYRGAMGVYRANPILPRLELRKVRCLFFIALLCNMVAHFMPTWVIIGAIIIAELVGALCSCDYLWCPSCRASISRF